MAMQMDAEPGQPLSQHFQLPSTLLVAPLVGQQLPQHPWGCTSPLCPAAVLPLCAMALLCSLDEVRSNPALLVLSQLLGCLL